MNNSNILAKLTLLMTPDSTSIKKDKYPYSRTKKQQLVGEGTSPL